MSFLDNLRNAIDWLPGMRGEDRTIEGYVGTPEWADVPQKQDDTQVAPERRNAIPKFGIFKNVEPKEYDFLLSSRPQLNHMVIEWGKEPDLEKRKAIVQDHIDKYGFNDNRLTHDIVGQLANYDAAIENGYFPAYLFDPNDERVRSAETALANVDWMVDKFSQYRNT